MSRQRRAQSQVLFLSSSLFLSYTSPSLLRRLAQTPSVASISSVASNTEVLGCRGANLAWLRESISLGALFRDFLLNGSSCRGGAEGTAAQCDYELINPHKMLGVGIVIKVSSFEVSKSLETNARFLRSSLSQPRDPASRPHCFISSTLSTRCRARYR